MKKQQNKNNIGKVLAIGAGVAGSALAAYMLFGKDGAKNRKAVRGWAVKMKGEIMEKFENSKEVSENMYHEIVDKAHKKYATLKNVDEKELQKTIAEIKKHWKDISGKKKK